MTRNELMAYARAWDGPRSPSGWPVCREPGVAWDLRAGWRAQAGSHPRRVVHGSFGTDLAAAVAAARAARAPVAGHAAGEARP